jgi:hypothetical protein
VKIDRMDHRALGGVLEVYLDLIADPHPQKRPRNFSVEGPKPKVVPAASRPSSSSSTATRSTRTVCGSRRSIGPGQVGRLARNVRVGDPLGGR